MSGPRAPAALPGGNGSRPAAPASRDRTYDVDAPLRLLARSFGTLVAADARAELAQLKRLDPDRPDTFAVFRLLATCVDRRFLGDAALPIEAPGSEVDMLRRYAAVVAIMALRPDGLRPWGLGASMADAGVSDGRLSALLGARGAVLRDLARRLARRLARDADALAYLDLGRLLLMDGRPECHGEIEAVRIALAGEFQRAARKGKRESEAANDTGPGNGD